MTSSEIREKDVDGEGDEVREKAAAWRERNYGSDEIGKGGSPTLF